MEGPLSRRQLQQRNRLATAHLGLVPPIASRYAVNSPEPFEDLLQVGMLGLLRAAERYSTLNPVPFESYARPHIRGAILHHLRDRAWLVRLPRRQAERHHQLRHGCSSSGASQESRQLEPLLRWTALARPLSLESMGHAALDQTVDAEGTSMLVADGTDAWSYRPNALSDQWQDCTLAQMLNLLDPAQQRVLRCVVLQGWSYRRTAAALGTSAATVQRRLHAGLALLRSRLAEPLLSAQPSRQRHRAPSAAAGC